MVALGFATAENLQYLFEIQKDIEISATTIKSIVSRSLLLPLIHMSFSLYSGYTFGKAIYMRWDLIDDHNISRLRKWFKKNSRFAGDRYVAQTTIIIVGIINACLIHIAYNFFLEQGMIGIALVFSVASVFIFFGLLMHMKKNKHYQTLKERIHIEQQIKKLKEEREKRLS